MNQTSRMDHTLQINWSNIKRRLHQDGCVDLLRGMACLRESLLTGMSYEEAVQPWKRNAPELFKIQPARSVNGASNAQPTSAPK